MNKEDNFKEKFKEKLVKENFEYNSVCLIFYKNFFENSQCNNLYFFPNR